MEASVEDPHARATLRRRRPQAALVVLIVLLATIQPHRCLAAPESHRVWTLPGWHESTLPSAIYSGMVTVPAPPNHTEARHLHYVFVESMRNPRADPVMLCEP
jgi:hypothetical protein